MYLYGNKDISHKSGYTPYYIHALAYHESSTRRLVHVICENAAVN